MADVWCARKTQAQPVVCQPVSRWDEEMTQKTVICYDCRIEQPGGDVAVKSFYDQQQEKK